MFATFEKKVYSTLKICWNQSKYWQQDLFVYVKLRNLSRSLLKERGTLLTDHHHHVLFINASSHWHSLVKLSWVLLLLPIYSLALDFLIGCLVENAKIVETLFVLVHTFASPKLWRRTKKVHVLKIEFLLSSEIDSNKLVLPAWFFSSFF